MNPEIRVTEPHAQAADRARRAGAARGIAAVFTGLTFVSSALPLLMGGGPWASLVELAASAAFATAWWRSRQESSSPVGAWVIGILLLQQFGSSASVDDPGHVVQISYFTGLVPLVAAVTLRSRGVTWACASAVVALAGQMLMHADLPGATLASPFVFVLATCIISLFASVASQRALAAHAAEEQRALASAADARAAEARYRLVAEKVSDLVALLDSEGRYLFVSPSFERLLGIAPESLLGRTSPELTHPDDLPAVAEAYNRAREVGRAAAIARVRAADGSFRWFDVQLSRVEHALEQDAMALSARDITEQRKLAEELEGTRRMEALGRLAGGVAHDFNNLLLVIQSCTELAASELAVNHSAQRDLTDIRHATERAAALTQQLLAFAKRQILPGPDAAPVAELVRGFAPILGRLCGNRIAIELLLDGCRRRSAASSVELEQILMNLAANARDALPRGGVLRITLADRDLAAGDDPELEAGRYVELAVSDTGAGMLPEVQARIFEPFFTTKAPGRGTGLGLATVFGVVTQLRGRISARSTPGQGSTFTILLPESREAGAVPALSEPSLAIAARAESLEVLVVEDEEAVRQLITRVLRAAGHRVTEAESSAAARTATETARFDVIVTDVVLGSEGGIDLLEHMRATQSDATLVVLSGFVPDPERLAALAQRGAVFLPKPFGAAALLAALPRRAND